MGARLLKWVFFTVLVSFTPLILTGLVLWADDKMVVSSLWPHGELLLISTAIAADAIGEMIPTGPRARAAKIVAVGSCVLLLIISALWYAVIQIHGFNAGKISESSLFLFAGTLIASLGCQALAEGVEQK
jgi:hypothetical protein